MFQKFTERARQVVVFAQLEARDLRHNYIGTEHLLLGLLREEEGVAARVLVSLGVTTDAVRDQVARLIGVGDEPPQAGQVPFTPRAKKALELALREALSLGHNYIGTEHVLLGVARVTDGVAARVLRESFDVDADKIRDEVVANVPEQPERPRSFPLPGRPRRRRWRYRVVELGEPSEDALNELGAEGWELVAVTGDRAIFKRPS
jgi:ATP-dependent Clp protease ATP-binding subunit ClpA